MKRSTMLLVGLGAVLLVVAWYFLLFAPKNEELAAVETQITDVQAQQQTTRTRIVALQGVREQAPQLQAGLAAAESILPRDTALPSALRQLQQAADESGATLVSVAPSRPEVVEGANPELFAMSLTVELRGTYFQVVDVLRRIEDPAISPRGVSWSAAALTIDEAAPDLVAVLTGRMFAVLPSPPAPDTGEAAPVEGEEAADGTEAEVEAEVEVDTETEDDQ